MKTILKFYFIGMAFVLLSFKVANIIIPEQEKVIFEPKELEVIAPTFEPSKVKIDLKNHSSFLDKIGFVESSNDYTKVNRFGYMGKYQFGRETLEALNIEVTKKKFLSTPSLQEEAMDKLLKANHKNLRRFIKKYDGKVLHGVLVTESGVLAAAHLGGAGNVRDWFRKGDVFKDGNGTPITKYMKVFSGYNLNVN